jgi:formate dehydrogenase
MGQRRAVTPFLLRTLTTAREKVKVLLVLYDGGQHAKDVS